MRTLVVVQARMGSSRLPGKVMLPLAGRPLLERMLQRVLAAEFPFQVCVATSTAPDDEPIRQLGKRLAVPVVSGHPTDLLERHLLAGRTFNADVIAKIPSDCPLIDPAVVDTVFTRFVEGQGAFDLVTNLNPPSWPDGNDVEILPMRVLELAGEESHRDLAEWLSSEFDILVLPAHAEGGALQAGAMAAALCRQLRCVVVSLPDGGERVAMADPWNDAVVQKIAAALKRLPRLAAARGDWLEARLLELPDAVEAEVGALHFFEQQKKGAVTR